MASADQSPLAQVRFSLDNTKEVQNGYCGFFLKAFLKLKKKLTLLRWKRKSQAILWGAC